MPFGGKALDALEERDLQSLVDAGVDERKTIEYKSALPGGGDAEKKEFLADVSSFANASGGHLIFGVEAKDGIPRKVSGLDVDNADQVVLRLDNLVREGIRERIPGYYIRPVKLSNGRFVIVIRIPHSWSAPHMVIYQQWSRFYARNSNGKHPLDIGEIRSAFLRSATTAERIRNFRIERINQIVAEQFPTATPLADAPKLILHIVPISAFDAYTSIDVTRCTEDTSLRGMLMPLGAGGSTHIYNYDGFLTFSQIRGHDGRLTPPYAYAQLYRNGCVEGVNADLLRLRDSDKLIPSRAYEEYTLRSLSDYQKVLERLGVEPPLFVMLTLLGVRGYKMAVGDARFQSEGYPIDRDMLAVPEVVIETFDTELAPRMKPAFDVVWNATGWPRSQNYDAQGHWLER